jgi:photosystem II stability/assembly factor-like uncharacterized protein
MKPIVTFIFSIVLLCQVSRAQNTQSNPDQNGNPPQTQSLGWVQVPIANMSGATFLSYPSRDTAYCMAAISSQMLTTGLMSVDGGLTWQSFSTPPLWAMTFFDGKYGYTAGYTTHTAYHTSDGGQSWTSADDSDQRVSMVCPITKDTCFLAGNIFISRTTDAGKSWHSRAINMTGILGMAFADSKHGIVVGEVQPGPLPFHTELTAGCYTTSDGGQTWVQQYSGSRHSLTGVTYCTHDTLVAVGGYYFVSRSRDGGQTWDSIPNPTLDRIHGVIAVASSGRFVLSVGGSGIISSSQDYGITWQRQLSGVSTDLNSIAMRDDSNALAAGDAGVILKTTNGGKDWVQVSPPSSQSLTVLSFQDPETPNVEIVYDLPQLQNVKVSVYNLMGKQIAILANGELQQPGKQRLIFNSSTLPSATYLITITTNRYHATGKFEIIH